MTRFQSTARRLGVGTIIAIGIGLFFVAPASAGTATWDAPTVISTATSSMGEPRAVVAPNGSVAVTWAQSDSGGNRVMASESTDGETWSEPAQLSEESNSLLTPSIAVDANSTFVVSWTIRSGGTFLVQTAVSSGGVDWSEPHTVSNPAHLVGQESLSALPGGGFVLAWAAYFDDTRHVLVSTSADGTSWSSMRVAAWPVDDVNYTSVTVAPSGRTLVGFHTIGNAPGSLNAAVSDDLVVWTTCPQIAAADASISQVNFIPVGSGGFVGAWWNWNGTSGRIESAFSNDGLSWSTPTALSANGVNASKPRLARNQAGRIVAAWATNDDDTFSRQSVLSDDGGANWTAPTTIETGIPRSTGFALAANPDGSFAAVLDNTLDGTVHTVEFVPSDDGSSWGTPEPLEGVPSRGFAPQLLALDDAHWLTLWNATIDDQTALVSFLRTAPRDPVPSPAALAATGPQLTALLAVSALMLAGGTLALLRRRAS